MFDRMVGRKVTEDSSSSNTFDGEFSAPKDDIWSSHKHKPNTLPAHQKDHLDCTSRKMADLKLDYNRTVKSLRKWKHSFISNIATYQLQTSRYRLLNSRLLYHLSFLRPKADIGSLDRVTSALDDPLQFQRAAIDRVYQWSRTQNAEHALQHALAIWALIFKESEWDPGRRARFNILSIISLYHAAMVVWAYAGSHEAPSSNLPNMNSSEAKKGSARDLPIYRGNSRLLLGHFVNLFRRVTAGWSAVSSFAETVALMAKQPCPVPSSL